MSAIKTMRWYLAEHRNPWPWEEQIVYSNPEIMLAAASEEGAAIPESAKIMEIRIRFKRRTVTVMRDEAISFMRIEYDKRDLFKWITGRGGRE